MSDTVRCYECDSSISRLARICPHCRSEQPSQESRAITEAGARLLLKHKTGTAYIFFTVIIGLFLSAIFTFLLPFFPYWTNLLIGLVGGFLIINWLVHNSPESVGVRWIGLPLAAALAILTRLQWAYYKKHL